MDILTFLMNRLVQLKDRRTMIPRYVERPQNFIGKKDFSLNDLPKIQEDIDETIVAIQAIELMRKQKKEKKKLANNHTVGSKIK